MEDVDKSQLLKDVERLSRQQHIKEENDKLKSSANRSVHHISQDLSGSQLSQSYTQSPIFTAQSKIDKVTTTVTPPPVPLEPPASVAAAVSSPIVSPPADPALTEKTLQEIEQIAAKNNVDLQVPEKERAIEKKKFSIREFIKEEWHKLKQSLRQLRKDAFRLYCFMLTKEGTRAYTVPEYIDKQRIKYDLVKFIPYGIMIILPFGELFLLPYLVLFPNAIPTQFLNEKSIGEALKKNEDRQSEAYEVLMQRLRPLFKDQFDAIKEIKDSLKHDPFNPVLRHEIARLDREITLSLMRHWNVYQNSLTFDRLTIDEMDYVLKFGFFDYVDGVHIINLIMNAHRRTANMFCKYILRVRPRFAIKRYTFNVFPLNELRKEWLRLQLIKQSRRIAIEDYLSEQHPDSLATMKSADLYTFARQRGIKVAEDRDRLRYYLEWWMTETRNIANPELKFWVTLMRFKYGKYLV